jgi:hypothetical protein
MQCDVPLTQYASSLSLPGAPELDILEAMPGKEVLEHTSTQKPYYSASLQISPGKYQPMVQGGLMRTGLLLLICCLSLMDFVI